jgi:hypothetical protein
VKIPVIGVLELNGDFDDVWGFLIGVSVYWLRCEDEAFVGVAQWV